MAGHCRQILSQQSEGLSEGRRLADDDFADPGQTRWRLQELCGFFTNVDRRACFFCQPIEIANMFFMRVGADDALDLADGNSPPVFRQGTAHFWRAGINNHAVIEDRRKQFPKEEWHYIREEPVQIEDGELSPEKIRSAMMSQEENRHPFERTANGTPYHQRETDKESGTVAEPKRAGTCLLADGIKLCYAAGSAATFAQRMAIARDEPISKLAQLFKWQNASRCPDNPCPGRQASEPRNCVPSSVQTPIGTEHMELAQTGIKVQSCIELAERIRSMGIDSVTRRVSNSCSHDTQAWQMSHWPS